jgi:hypothetical protein
MISLTLIQVRTVVEKRQGLGKMCADCALKESTTKQEILLLEQKIM